MRITFTVSSLHFGGAERVACLLANQWQQMGHQVTFIVTFSGRGKVAHDLAEGIEVSFLADQSTASAKTPIGQIQRSRALRKIIISSHPDVVVSFLSRVNVGTVLATRGLGTPVIVSERTYPPAVTHSWFFEQLRRWAYSKATAVVVQTEAANRWLAAVCPDANGAVIANPLKLPLANNKGKVVAPDLEDKKLILSVGRLVELKGHRHLINAFAKIMVDEPVLAKQWRLVIAGDGPEEENLAALIERHGLTEHIRLLGNIGNIADWLEEAEIYVHSAEFEGFPNSLIEAMAHHTACLSVDCPVGPGEVIEHELNGLLASPKDPEESLVAPLLTLMGDPNLRQQYAEEAMKVISRLDAHNIAQKWLDLFASLKR